MFGRTRFGVRFGWLILPVLATIIGLRLGLQCGAEAKAPKPKHPPKEASNSPLSADEAVKTMDVPDDLAVDLITAEPVVEQPVFLNFDERGRMWVVQYRQYPDPAGLELLSKDRHWRAVYDKVPSPPGHPDFVPGADKITIHEDADGDGVFEKVETFVGGLNIVTSVVRGRGGVWVLNPPYLLFYPDKNDDDVPDGPPTVHLEGFGLEDTHSVVNSLCWGPDGWLYAAQVSTVSANVKIPGTEMKPIHSHGQHVWRYHPDKKIYEVFAEGGGNIWSCVFDSAGRLFGGTNGTPRGYHYVQGGYYRKNFIKHGELSNLYTFGYFQGLDFPGAIRLHNTITIYEGGALPARYEGTILGANPLAGWVDVTYLDPDGSSFAARDGGIFVSSLDRWFRPVDVKVGPDGAVYIADWYDRQVSHLRNYEGQISKKNGRIYRVRNRDAKPLEPFDLSKMSTDELIGLFDHENRWFRSTALRLIGDRRDLSVLPRLRRMVEAGRGPTALLAFWALNLTGGFTGDMRLLALRHEDPHIRSWAIRLIGDDRKVTEKEAEAMAELARTDPSAEVRGQLASTAKRLMPEPAMNIISGLLGRDEDADDPFIPLLIWWAIESKCSSDAQAVIKMFHDRSLWSHRLSRQYISGRLIRRFASTGKRQDLVICAEILALSDGTETTEKLLAGFERAYRGRAMTNLPDILTQQLAKLGGGSLVMRLRQGDPKAIEEGIELITNSRAPANRRQRVIEALGEAKYPNAVHAFTESLDDPNDSIVKSVLMALQSYDEISIGSEVVRRHAGFSDSTRPVAQSLLASRRAWSLQLAEAVDSGKIEPQDVLGEVIASMRMHQDEKLEALITKVWGSDRSLTGDEKVSQIDRVRSMIHSSKSRDPYVGRELFLKRCGVCHTLYDEGGNVGPSLTGYQRGDLESLLKNIIDPSSTIREGFEGYTFLIDDGRIINGFLADEDDNVLVIRPIGGENIVLQRDRIEAVKPTKKSLMPDGLLNDLSDRQVLDLFAFLQTGQPMNVKGMTSRSALIGKDD